MFILANFSNFWITNFQGELAALGVAFLWALTSVIYKRLGKQIPPLAMNLSKGAIASAMLIFTLGLNGQLLPAIDPVPFSLLLCSGAIGIGVGDTAYFSALNRLGARRTLLLKTLGPPFAAVVSALFLHEQLTSAAWSGIFLTILGVAWVISERANHVAGKTEQLIPGISFALLSAFTDAMGGVLSRAAMAQTSIDPMWSALVRIVAGMLALLLWLGLGRQTIGVSPKELRSGKLLGVIALCAFLSTYLGFWLQQISLKFTAAGIAKSLGATSPLFVLPLAIWMGEAVSLRAILGVLVALAGVGLLFSFR